MARNRTEPWHSFLNNVLWNKPTAWQRGLWMLLFWLISSALGTVLMGIALLQFFSLLLTEQPQRWLAEFGTRLNLYQYHLWQYLLAATEQKPTFSDTEVTPGAVQPAAPEKSP